MDDPAAAGAFEAVPKPHVDVNCEALGHLRDFITLHRIAGRAGLTTGADAGDVAHRGRVGSASRTQHAVAAVDAEFDSSLMDTTGPEHGGLCRGRNLGRRGCLPVG